MSGELLRWFEDLGRDDVNVAGGKGASLGELSRAGATVPPGFVVTTDAWDAFMAEADPEGDLRGVIEGLSHDDLEGLAEACVSVRERMTDSAFPAELQEPLEAAYFRLAGPDGTLPVAVRSSATAEDSADASFAGLQDTYLWVRGLPAMLHALRRCWASWYNDESVAYRRKKGMSEEGIGMAVVIQRMVDPLCSGVMFSRSPTTGDRSVVAIEGSWGLGSAIVSGEVTPDRYVVNKVTREVIEREIADKANEHVPDPSGQGVQEREVDADRRKAACLDDAQIATLTQIAKQIEKHYGCAQDMEWALSKDPEPVFYLLQSRPETVWANKEPRAGVPPKAAAFEHVFAVLGGQKKS